MMLKGWKKDIAVIVFTAILFFAVSMPFRTFFRVLPVTEVRPASAFNPVFGLVFGVPGAVGCALGNLAADLSSGYTALMCIMGAVVQLVYGIFPRIVWGKERKSIRMNTSESVLRYMLIMLFDSLITAVLLGIVMQITRSGAVLSMATLMLFLNNFVFCMILGVPILLVFIGHRMKKREESLSLNERFILFFLFLAILSAAMIGLIAYRELNHQITDMLDLWNRVYIYIAANLFVFCIVIVCFLRYAEKNITVPMEKLAAVATDYISAGSDGKPDTKYIIQQCSEYTAIPGEAGALAETFLDMAVNLEEYIDNLTRVTAERERIGTELNVAAKIQADMLPNSFPAFPDRKEFGIYASMKPAKEVGGDFYDFFLIDQDHLALVIADVSDKGVPAALFMVTARTLIKNQTLMEQSPQEILKKVNNQLCENNKEKMFVTVWLGILEISTGRLTAANAGHEYPAVRGTDGKFVLYKDRHGLVLAGMKNIPYRQYELQLEKGHSVFVYTDGVVEAADRENHFYGTDRMLETLNRSADADPEGLIRNVAEDVEQFVNGAKQFDDITMLCLTYYGIQGTEKRLTVPASVESWENALEFLNGFLDDIGCQQKEKLRIDTAAEEIFVNIARYAYPGKAGEVTVIASADQEKHCVRVTFRDRGIPWNPLENPDTDITLPVSQRKIGGLGILMVKKLMDDTVYEYSEGENVFTIVKKIG